MYKEIPNVPSVQLFDHLKLRASVAVVGHENYTEFFLTDIRTTITISLQAQVADMLFSLDGKKTVEEWIIYNKIEHIPVEDILHLLNFLRSKCILLQIDCSYPNTYKKHKRLFAFLENYCETTSQVLTRFKRIDSSCVMIIGLGAVGTWVTQSLAMAGVRSLILVDPDKVELSNLHRQVGFRQSDVGRLKVEAFAEYLDERYEGLQLVKIVDILDEVFFYRNPYKPTLIINSADYPSVDVTSKIVGEYAMEHGIAHCIGGGYNLHQSLVGQIVIPGQTACVECFRLELEEINVIDTTNIRRLDNPYRKVGSLPPLSTLSAAITSNEAIKYIAGLDCFTMTNSRTEFSLRDMNFKTIKFRRRPECKYCGCDGKYYRFQGDSNK